MADYERMYALLCGAVDDAIDALEKVPAAEHISQALQSALLEAEEIYICTSSCPEKTEEPKIPKLNIDTDK